MYIRRKVWEDWEEVWKENFHKDVKKWPWGEHNFIKVGCARNVSEVLAYAELLKLF